MWNLHVIVMFPATNGCLKMFPVAVSEVICMNVGLVWASIRARTANIFSPARPAT